MKVSVSFFTTACVCDIDSQLFCFLFLVYIVCFFFFVYEPYRAYLCFTASVFFLFSCNIFNFVVQSVCVVFSLLTAPHLSF